jgi:hypothetical protein
MAATYPVATRTGSVSASTGLAEPGVSLPVVAVLAAALALVHLAAGRLHLAGRIPRSRWLSFAGGTAIAYVFVHLLPELEAAGRTIGAGESFLTVFFEHHVYLVALVGFVVFYGLERFVTRANDGERGVAERVPDAGVFWVHVGSFALYNALIGYSLYDHPNARTTALFALAMGFHFTVNDAGFREHHAHRYDRIGRWVLAAAVLLGAAIEPLFTVDETTFAVLLAFLAGGIILNTIKEELPDERESRFSAFATGAAAYAAVLLLV